MHLHNLKETGDEMARHTRGTDHLLAFALACMGLGLLLLAATCDFGR